MALIIKRVYKNVREFIRKLSATWTQLLTFAMIEKLLSEYGNVKHRAILYHHSIVLIDERDTQRDHEREDISHVYSETLHNSKAQLCSICSN